MSLTECPSLVSISSAAPTGLVQRFPRISAPTKEMWLQRYATEDFDQLQDRLRRSGHNSARMGPALEQTVVVSPRTQHSI